ncbi:MAG: TetR/AcrR family transcriptional regulator [Nocardioides sp.]|uniref:TetR/AcrR family transcriptional regulator n=1 Tax=Nocardioides sp. TaxID=35761 RepID=UPI003F047E3D
MAELSSEDAPRHGTARPGGRTELNRIAVHDAVIAELQARGLDFSYSDLAQRSGVSRRTLHRRWPDRTELIHDALRSAYGDFAFTATGDLAADVHEFARRFRDFSTRPTTILVDGLAALAPDDELSRLSRRAFGSHTVALRTVVADARRARHLDDGAEVDTLLLMLISPIVVSSTILRAPMSDPDLARLADLVVRAALSPSAG